MPKQIKSTINLNLNQLPINIGKKCIRCGRQWPDTILNIEGIIHHRGIFQCLDTKSCMAIVKKRQSHNKAKTKYL
jgi:hypothetical protein